LPLSILDEDVPPEVIEAVGRQLELSPGGTVRGLLGGIWACFRNAECLLVEVNPCLVSEGRLVAADAKVVIDDDARRLPAEVDRDRDHTPFEAACAAAGATATELSGNVAIIASGAGLAMATLDAIVRLGGQVRCVVDLGYSTLESQDALERVIELVYGLAPRVILVNAFLQMARCTTLADMLGVEVRRASRRVSLVARLTGNEAEGVDGRLAATGVIVAPGMESAVATAVRLAAAG
jgi:succinyl-CoA synthetase beta subunit